MKIAPPPAQQGEKPQASRREVEAGLRLLSLGVARLAQNNRAVRLRRDDFARPYFHQARRSGTVSVAARATDSIAIAASAAPKSRSMFAMVSWVSW